MEPFLLGVDPAQVRVPANRYDIGKEQTVLQRNEGEVDDLDGRPEHPVGLQRWPPSLADSFLCTLALHGGHAAKEYTYHDRCKTKLITGDPSEDLCLLVPRHINSACEESEPCCSNRTEHNCKKSTIIQMLVQGWRSSQPP
jgi:hypothetical protein